MKKILFISFTSLALLFSVSCKKKKSDPEDPCANTVCLNGGTCSDGSCSCPAGYSGADCGTQKTPTKIKITAVKVTKFPALSGTSTWDNITGTNPDIFVKIKAVGSTTIALTSGRVDEAAAGTSYTLPGVTPTDFTNLSVQYNIELIDYDTTSSNDTMGNATFDLYTNTNHFPTTLIVTNATATTAATIAFELTLEYTY